jgi:flagellar FliL protein
MSDEETEAKEAETEPKAKRGKLPIVIALTLGLTIGALAGSLVVGPLVAEKDTAKDCTVAEAEATDAHGAPIAKPVYTVNDLVLNPAQSGGTRYLVLTIAFSVRDSATVEKMKSRDSEVRDILLKVLGAKTVPQLSDMATRPALKEEVRAQVGRLFGAKTISDVYFPQYVIQ